MRACVCARQTRTLTFINDSSVSFEMKGSMRYFLATCPDCRSARTDVKLCIYLHEGLHVNVIHFAFATVLADFYHLICTFKSHWNELKSQATGGRKGPGFSLVFFVSINFCMI